MLVDSGDEIPEKPGKARKSPEETSGFRPHLVPTFSPQRITTIMTSYEIHGSSIRGIVRVPGGGKKTATFDNTPHGMREYETWADRMEVKKALQEFTGHAGGITVGELLESYEEVAR